MCPQAAAKAGYGITVAMSLVSESAQVVGGWAIARSGDSGARSDSSAQSDGSGGATADGHHMTEIFNRPSIEQRRPSKRKYKETDLGLMR